RADEHHPRPRHRGGAVTELTLPDQVAVKTLIAHQRRDIGSFICGWGVDNGDLGRSHSLHVWRELQTAGVAPADWSKLAAERDRLAAAVQRVEAMADPDPAACPIPDTPDNER